MKDQVFSKWVTHFGIYSNSNPSLEYLQFTDQVSPSKLQQIHQLKKIKALTHYHHFHILH